MVNMDALREKGWAWADPMTSGEIAEAVFYLSTVEVTNGHVWAKGKERVPNVEQAQERNWPCFSCHMSSTVKAPHLLEAALATMPVAREYFGEAPLLYSMNTFWTAPSHSRYEDTHDWHRDTDDRKQLVLFYYGTDIKVPQDGAHLYQPGSHHKGDHELGYDLKNPPHHDCIRGPAGSIFVADTSGVHMGLRPRRLRMLCWARWGVSDPPQSYGWDELSPVPREEIGSRYPSDPDLQRAIHLVVQ